MLQFGDAPFFLSPKDLAGTDFFLPYRGREAVPGKIMQPNRAKKNGKKNDGRSLKARKLTLFFLPHPVSGVRTGKGYRTGTPG